ncbi:MAG: alanine racemase [bacterium]
MTDASTRVRAEIDLNAILYNMESMHAHISGHAGMIAVIKANGYGHGAARIAAELESLPYVWGYAAATFEEAKEIRQAGSEKPVLILGHCFPYCYRELADYAIRPAVFRRDSLGQLSEAALSEGHEIRIHIAVDTGMTRIGIRPDDEGLSFVKAALETPGIMVEGIFTHFARADEWDREATERQIRLFEGFTDRIREELGYDIPLKHCSNSAGIIEYPKANMDLVRAGITLYGLWPSREVHKQIVPLRPVMSLKSHIVYIKDVPSGVRVSYGGTYETVRPTRIATIPVGYADGYPRSLSGRGCVLIRGKKAPILGRVCMDQFMVDVTHIPEAAEDDEVVLMGRDGDQVITAEELGDLSGRFNYELVCDISERVPRIYVRN